jgi:thymidylate kinase
VKRTRDLIAVDGVNGRAVDAGARALASVQHPARRAAISAWDASGIFGELRHAGSDAGRPSPRTLLLLYATDLAFRLRWEIRPALAEGRTVIVAPYVDTAVAFGRAAGLDAGWLGSLFGFAPPPEARWILDDRPARFPSERAGFVELGWEEVERTLAGATRRRFLERARLSLDSVGRRHGISTVASRVRALALEGRKRKPHRRKSAT